MPPIAAVAIDREIAQQRRGFAGDQIADQARGEKTECDAVAAIAVGRVDALAPGTGPISGKPSLVVSNVPDQRNSISVFAAGQSAASLCASTRDFSGIRRSRASGSTISVLSSPPMMIRPARVVRA